MNGVPTTFWGKLEQADGGNRWHPLVDHCCDVAAVAEALLGIPLWRKRIARLAGRSELDPTTCARLCVFCVLHDLGKLTIPFQAKGRSDLGQVTGGHVEPGIAAVLDSQLCTQFQPVSGFGDGTLGLLVTALAHHGKPLSFREAESTHQATHWLARAGLDPAAGLGLLVQACQRWFPAAFGGGPELPTSFQLQHAFAGLVMLADWIGSDPEFFPFASVASDRMLFSRQRAKEVVAQLRLDVPVRARADAGGRPPFDRVSGFKPRAAQCATVALPDEPAGSIAVLESETGSGKTEAALAHFVRLFTSGDVDGLYFALPTRTAATQIFERVKAAAKRAFADPPAVVLAVPGYLQVDDAEGRRLPGFEVLWPDKDRFRFRGWAAEGPKRYLAGTIVVGTIDQVLLSSLMVGHAHLRATALLRHLLVVDEVHASDTYMTRILEDVLARHVRAGGHALLLSATLAGEARRRLLLAGASTGTPGPAAETALAAPYPLLSFRAAAGISVQEIAVAHDSRSRNVAVETTPELEDPGAVARRAADAARAGAKVLVLRNTVADCVATQSEVERALCAESQLLFRCVNSPAPHHGRFARDDRKALDAALEKRIGKERVDGGCVVVATQTVQQSLDLDADLLLTDLCPVDVLLQRIGRLHRHERTRPGGYDKARAVVLVPSNRDLSVLVGAAGRPRNHHGLGSVYHDLRVLEATWQALCEHSTWTIPAMSRALVEGCLHSTRLDEIVRECGAQFAEHRTYLLGEWLGHRRTAELNLVDWNKPYAEMTFPTAVNERIQTRLGEGDRRVQFTPPVPGPFGLPVRELSIPAWWAAGVSADEETASNVTTQASVTRFSFGPKRFIYDRLGLRIERVSDTKEEKDDDGP